MSARFRTVASSLSPVIAVAVGAGVYSWNSFSNPADNVLRQYDRQASSVGGEVTRCSNTKLMAYSPTDPSIWNSFISWLGWTTSSRDFDLPTDKLSCKRDASSHTGAHRPVVLVSCGSFNPPTIQHLRMFDLAQQALIKSGYDVLGGYLSPVNDKYNKPTLIPAHHRIQMCNLAASTSPLLMVDPWEASQPHYQRTITVLQRVDRKLREVLHGDDQTDGHTETAVLHDVKVMLLCGGDVLESMLKPGAWLEPQLRKLLDNHGVVCVAREGSRVQELVDTPGTVLHEFRHNITLVDEPVPNDISSSRIRNELLKGHCVRYLTPDPVLEYIQKNKLYSP